MVDCVKIIAKLTAKHYGLPMPRGPKGKNRPANANRRAVVIARIAAGEIEDKVTVDGRNAAAVALGRRGGNARAAGMTAKRRKEIAKKAAAMRWRKYSHPSRRAADRSPG